jgi:hypothetical protein
VETAFQQLVRALQVPATKYGRDGWLRYMPVQFMAEIVHGRDKQGKSPEAWWRRKSKVRKFLRELIFLGLRPSAADLNAAVNGTLRARELLFQQENKNRE